MDSMIRIGTEKESIQELGSQIVEILREGHESHADQDTIRHALSTLQAGSEVKGVTIANNQFSHNGATGNSIAAKDPREERIITLLERLLNKMSTE